MEKISETALAVIIIVVVLSCLPRFRRRTQMDEQRKYAILFVATILAARKLNESGNKPWQYTLASLTQSTGPASSSKD